jgi:ATP-binding cassette, subfamily B, bacterial CvaB/MchF/RaxB
MDDHVQNHQKAVGTRLRLIMQSEVAECGLACIVMIANSYGHDMDLASARVRFGTSIKGSTLASLLLIANQLGLTTRPIRAELEYLRSIEAPCILHWDMNHFVVLHRVNKKRAEIYDPARGVYTMPLNELSKHFTGILVELSPTECFTPVKTRRRITLQTVTGRIDGLRLSALQAFGLALMIELIGVAMPFQAQWALDQILMSQDIRLLMIVSVVFVVLITIHTLAGIARAFVISLLGAKINAQWVANLFSHLLRLPNL